MENLNINARLVSIHIISKRMYDAPAVIPEQFTFDIRVETKVNAPLKYVMPYVSVTVKGINSADPLAEITTACVFEIEEFDRHITMVDNLYQVPGDVDLTLRQAAVGTTRGIIYAEFRGTHLHNAVMPLVYVQNFTAQP